MPKKVIEVKHLDFVYEDKPILHDISFSIEEGEYVGIIGENGSGKSTLLKLLIGNLKSPNGTIDLYVKKMGYLSQQVRNFNKTFPATVEEIIAANLYSEMGLFKILKREHKKKIDSVLDLVNMKDYKNRLIGTLSGGQQQRVFVARLLVSDPDIIFMDEPIVGLDEDSIKSFYDIMDKLNRELKITIIMVTHDTTTMGKKADKIISLQDAVMKIHTHKLQK